MAAAIAAGRRSKSRRGKVAACAILVGLIVVGFWIKRSRDHALRVGRITTAIEARRSDVARSELERWLRAEPRSAQAHFLKARLAWSMNDPAEVDQELTLARTLGYSEPDLDRAQGLLLARGDRKREAEAYLKQAIDGSRDADPEAAETLARLYLGAFRLEDAGRVLDDWARKAPGDARPLLLRTKVDIRLSAPPEVILDRFRSALDRDPRLAEARLGLAEQLQLNQRFEEAAVQYDAYLEIRPDDPIGLLGAGRNDLELGRLESGARLLDKALAQTPRDPVALGARATVEQRLGRFQSALAYLDRAVAADPFDAGNRYLRMIVLTRLGRRGDAENERKAVEKLKEDQAWFKRVSRELRHNPTDLGLRARAARWLMNHGHEQEAVEWANLVLHDQPAHPEINRLLADYYKRTGQTGLANHHEIHASPPKPGGEEMVSDHFFSVIPLPQSVPPAEKK